MFPTVGCFRNGGFRVNLGLEPFCFKFEECDFDNLCKEEVVELRGKRFPKYLNDYEIDFDDDEEDPPRKRKKKF